MRTLLVSSLFAATIFCIYCYLNKWSVLIVIDFVILYVQSFTAYLSIFAVADKLRINKVGLKALGWLALLGLGWNVVLVVTVMITAEISLAFRVEYLIANSNQFVFYLFPFFLLSTIPIAVYKIIRVRMNIPKKRT